MKNKYAIFAFRVRCKIFLKKHMFYSMTGVGIAETIEGEYKIHATIKSLNSKGIEISMRIPLELDPFEFSYRKKISSLLLRGKNFIFFGSNPT